MNETIPGAIVQFWLAEGGIFTDPATIPDNIISLTIAGWRGVNSDSYRRPQLQGGVSFCLQNCMIGSSSAFSLGSGIQSDIQVFSRVTSTSKRSVTDPSQKLSLALHFVNVTGSLLPPVERTLRTRLQKFYISFDHTDVLQSFDMWFPVAECNFDITSSTFHSHLNLQTTMLGKIESSTVAGLRLQVIPHGDETAASIRIFTSTFTHPIIIEGHQYTTAIYNNKFGILSDAPNGVMKSNSTCPSTSLSIHAKCSAIAYLDSNDFYSGPVGLISDCTLSGMVPIYFRARGNRFPIFQNADGVIVPAISFDSQQINDPSFFISQGSILDASGNWWGDSSGPWVCCNSLGKGSYATTLIDTSRWCINPECGAFSASVMDDNCKTRFCSLKLSKSLTGLFATSFGIGILLLLLVTVASIVQIKRTFSTASYQSMPVVDLLEQASLIQLRSCFAAIFGSILYIIATYILLKGNRQSLAAPRQQRLPGEGSTLLVLFLVHGAFHLVICLSFIIALLLRHWKPGLLKFLSNKLNMLNILLLAEIIPVTICIIGFLFPKQSWHTMTVSFTCGNTSNIPGRSAILCILPVVLVSFVSATIAIPNQILNNLLYHHDYMRINSSIEKSLLKELLRSPVTKQKTLRLRVAAGITILAAVAWIVGQSLSSLSPRSNSSVTMGVSSKLAFNISRFVVSFGFSVAAVLILIAIFWLSFNYKRPSVITFLACCLAICGFVCTINLVIVSIAAAQGASNNGVYRMAILELPTEIFFVLCVIICLAMLAVLRKHVLKRLPQLAVENLNGYLDEAWHTRNTIQAETIGLLAPED
jgi:hypothetical protein